MIADDKPTPPAADAKVGARAKVTLGIRIKRAGSDVWEERLKDVPVEVKVEKEKEANG